MLPHEERILLARIATGVLVLFAATVAVGVAVVLLLDLPGLVGAVVVTILVLALLGVLLVIVLIWQTVALVRLSRERAAVGSSREGEGEDG